MVLSTQYYRELGSSGNAKVCRLLIDKGSIYKPEGKIRQFRGISSGQSHLSNLNFMRFGFWRTYGHKKGHLELDALSWLSKYEYQLEIT